MRAHSVLRTKLAGASGAHTSFELLHRFPPQLPSAQSQHSRQIVHFTALNQTLSTGSIRSMAILILLYELSLPPSMPSFYLRVLLPRTKDTGPQSDNFFFPRRRCNIRNFGPRFIQFCRRSRPAIEFVPSSIDPVLSGYRGRADSSWPKKGRGERSKLRDSDRPLFHSSKPPPPRPICSSPGVSHTSPLP